MKLHLTRDEFLALWRILRGYSPLRTDTSVQRSDGMDLDPILLAEMDDWYLRLLLEADTAMLAPEDMAASVDMPVPDGGAVTLALPPEVVRVLAVKLSGWSRPACILRDPDSRRALMQQHPYTRACAGSPVAVMHTDGVLSLYPASQTDRLVTLSCAVRRDGEYVFDSAALRGVSSIDLSI